MATPTVKVSFVGDTTAMTKSLDKMSGAMSDAANDAKTAGKRINKELTSGFDGVRDSADNTERRIIGFKDSLTGTKDLTQGFAEGNLEMMAQGFADLASSVANLGADMLAWGKKAIEGGKNAVKAHAASVVATVKNTAATVAHRAAAIASAAAAKAMAAAQWVLNAAMSANPIMLVVAGLAALVAAFVIAWKNSETFRNIVTGAFDKVKAIAETVVDWIKTNWPLLLAVLTGPFGLAVLAIVKNWDTIRDAVTGAADWIRDRINDIVGFVTAIPGRITGVALTAFDSVKVAATGVKDWVRARIDDIVGFVTGIPGRIGAAASTAFDAVKNAVSTAMWGAFSTVLTVGGKIKNWFEDLPGNIKDGFSKLKDYLIAPFAAAFNAIADLWNKTVGSLSFKIPDWAPGIGGKGWDVPDIPKFASGGVVPGPMGAPQLAIVHGGEEVLTAAQRRGGGVTFNFINHGVLAGDGIDQWVAESISRARRRGILLD
jgi:phage-related protein